jgi:hypothetical protein
VVVPSSDEGLGLEVNTSDEEIEERVNDKHPHVQSPEDDGSSSDLEDEPSSPIIPKSTISSSAPSRQPAILSVEESVTGKPDRGHSYNQTEVVSEPESEGELSAIKSKRKASEVGFSIPPAKRPEPAEASVTESESDIDLVSPSCLPASASASTRKGTQQSIVETQLCAHFSSS